MNQNTLRENFWIWGHDAGCHHTPQCAAWKIPGKNTADAVEGAEYLGIPNCCRVVFNGKPAPPFDAESQKLTSFRQVVWSALGDASSTRNDAGADDLEEVIDQSRKYHNITGAILDDLFRPAQQDARVTPERMQTMADRLHRANLKLWIVYYASLLSVDYSRWLNIPDVITFWSWTSEDLENAEQNLNKIIAMTPGKQHYAGCYLYNYGDFRPLTDEEMYFQLELYKRLWLEREIDGIIVCSNTLVGTGLKAPEILRSWLKTNGEQTRS